MAPEFRPLLALLPDETLCSAVSRMHRLWGDRCAATTTSRLFGHHRAGSQHDLPCRLAHLAERTTGTYGDARRIAEDLTVLRFYRVFLPPDLHAHAVSVMAGDTLAHFKLRLGILTSRFRANHPLKACVACMTSDRNRFGWAYWHLTHQFPGVWYCHEHPDQPLRMANVKVNGVHRFLWHLPEESILAEEAFDFERRGKCLSAVRTLAHCTARLVSVSETSSLTYERIRRALLAEMRERGWASPTGRLRLRDASQSLARFDADARSVPELRPLPSTVEQAANELGRLLRSPRTSTHPIRYLNLVAWLFGDGQSFIVRLHEPEPHGIALASDTGATERGTAREAKSPLRDAALALIRDGHSARASAAQVGVDTKTVLAWAEQGELKTRRRPKRLKGHARERLLSMLRAGAAVEDAVAATGFSASTVNALLCADRELYGQRALARFALARTQARAAWSGAIDRVRPNGTSLARREAPAAYAWLYRHDKEWLLQHRPPAVRSRPRCRDELWVARDDELSSQIRKAVAVILSAAPGQPVPLGRICQAVPDLSPRLRKMQRLPKSKQALILATGSRDSENQIATGCV